MGLVLRPDTAPTLWTSPAALSDKEAAAQDLRKDVSSGLVDNRLFCLQHSPGLALIIKSNDFVAQLEFSTCAGCWKRLQGDDSPLTIHDTAVVELGGSGDRGTACPSIEVNHFLISELKCCMK